jgi:hypothetical protein
LQPRIILAAALITALAVFGGVFLVLAQPWESDEPDRARRPEASRPARMTLEGVIALVSQAHTGCPEQPALTLTADAVYNGDGTWTVTYRDYGWMVNEDDETIRILGNPLPCPRR